MVEPANVNFMSNYNLVRVKWLYDPGILGDIIG